MQWAVRRMKNRRSQHVIVLPEALADGLRVGALLRGFIGITECCVGHHIWRPTCGPDAWNGADKPLTAATWNRKLTGVVRRTAPGVLGAGETLGSHALRGAVTRQHGSRACRGRCWRRWWGTSRIICESTTSYTPSSGVQRFYIARMSARPWENAGVARGGPPRGL